MAKPTLKFRLGGKEFAVTEETQLGKRVMKFLDSSPDGKLYTMRQVAAKMEYSHRTFAVEHLFAPGLELYGLIVRRPKRQKVFGNKGTIAELSKHKGLTCA